MASNIERGDRTSGSRKRDFGAAAPWFCAALVLGVEASQKSAVLVILVAVSSLALLMLILVGTALWNPKSELAGRDRSSQAATRSAADSADRQKLVRDPAPGITQTKAAMTQSSS